MKRSASSLRSRWMGQEIPEAYEIKVYEIDNVQRMQKRAGADKQVLALFSFSVQRGIIVFSFLCVKAEVK